MVKQAFIAGRCGMMKLIDHHIIKPVGGPLIHHPIFIALDRDKQVIMLFGFMATQQQITKIGISEHSAKRFQALPQQLFTMGHKQQPGPDASLSCLLAGPVPVVKRGNHRLTGPRGRYHQVPVSSLHQALGVESIQNLLLKPIGPQLEQKRQGGRWIA